MRHLHRTLVFVLLLGIAPGADACVWDRDTLAMETRAFPTALDVMTGHFLRHSDGLYAWRVSISRQGGPPPCIPRGPNLRPCGRPSKGPPPGLVSGQWGRRPLGGSSEG